MTSTATAMIAGEPHETGQWYESVDPYTLKSVARVTDCSPTDAVLAVEQAEAALAGWTRTGVAQRRDVLKTAADELDRRRAELVDLAVRDAGALPKVAADTQVGAAIDRLKQWAALPGEVLDVPQPAADGALDARVRRAPLGVVACISPYNFPLLAMIGKVAPALFTGNTVVMKPAPQDPLLVVALAEALRTALREHRLPLGAVNLLTGASPELGAALTEHRGVRGVSFTGSTHVGIQIHHSAAATMKHLLLELGGKGALIARHDADPRAVVQAVTRTWTVHAGQVCLTPSRLIVDQAIHDEVVAGLRGVLTALRTGDPFAPSTTVGPVISAAQRDNIEELIDSARHQNCVVERSHRSPGTGFFVPPALITDCAPEHHVMQEEAFGPVLCVMRSRSDEEAVAAANSTRYALSDYIFTAAPEVAHALAPRLHAAQVGVNTTRRHPAAPFGGNLASGIGRSGGTWSIDAYTTLQSLTEESPGFPDA
ncbi:MULTISPECIES: aldehyde dehydrogenase family protein [Streptomyces]|uniref:Aldehyde dehydrogenase family protein n=1 Tax=Streptomyces doudnae TaxID=3075536 RepID=A0ABD5EVH1_9ACTN|nr:MULTISPECIES: aldehyde dehydrogenase family protein [unclassified Streptomyces]MDT0438640.1 aldehyde dehydrogenase family protein [Streptomyces sp. DSM 41981]MYQ69066.1 aldehyde dehydrogenase family protein [Streptomyces sp. SID4950]SCE51124.1 betaine-aldehyde dehydrogenase [Streptomyces sp. SolWspMP-5a-2]